LNRSTSEDETMPPDADTYWATVRDQRRALADQVGALDPAAWDSPSWCAGWRVRDVLGHLVHLAEASQLSMAGDMVRHGGRPNQALARCATRLGDLPVADLADRLRAGSGGRFHVPGMPRTIVLGEVLAHGSDMLRPLSLSLSVSAQTVTPVLDTYWRVGRVAFGTKATRRVRLVATDSEWAHGTGDEVRGTSLDLLLLLANRTQVLPALSGAGVDRLS
jgi:uncharacterized protein (TIGR03083 family)